MSHRSEGDKLLVAPASSGNKTACSRKPPVPRSFGRVWRVKILSSLLTAKQRQDQHFGSQSGSPLRHVNLVTALLSRLSNTLALRFAAS
jgi:hypothetical protein